jgi:hypothetical protein
VSLDELVAHRGERGVGGGEALDPPAAVEVHDGEGIPPPAPGALAPELRTAGGREALAEILGTSIYAVVNDLAAWWFEHPEVPREELVDVAYDLLWSGLAAFAVPSD